MTRVVVFHRGYGCDTGCCGHAVEVDGEEIEGSFQFEHPYTDDLDAMRKWAEQFVLAQMGPEHVADLDWENCLVVDD